MSESKEKRLILTKEEWWPIIRENWPAYDKEKNIPIYKVGNAEVRFIKQRPLIDWTVRWMEYNRR